MKRLDFVPLLLLIPVVGFVGYQVLESPAITATSEAAVLEPAAKAPKRTASAKSRAETPAAVNLPAAAPSRDIADIRERLREGMPGTYLGEVLTGRDSALARWPERISRPVRVWVGTGQRLPGWKPEFESRVRAAFEEWGRLGIPVHFTFVVDSAGADVHVNWVSTFDEPISGKTLWARDKHWWIVKASITLALHHNGGEALDSRAIKAIALHEIGHLLGLDHTADTSNIMTARVRVRELSEADRATIRLLYSLPPGSVKG
ncbi:MAG TPA: matrixin family metalloprotease [Gemmatimonadaceae bacterium]|nr:matrixin family metalloprotease [Gemmatimonadaceae bacterium]